ncbi:unnamed protein product [Strongylus vulgaris]|uniref:Uncharacterized protein n=1 Tax=Strongylus vulgaris TaxID=40348 RepID=A0A3P7KDB0_STRVU|nr:unnamed protein product [Strongylus vulgaris]
MNKPQKASTLVPAKIPDVEEQYTEYEVVDAPMKPAVAEVDKDGKRRRRRTRIYDTLADTDRPSSETTGYSSTKTYETVDDTTTKKKDGDTVQKKSKPIEEKSTADQAKADAKPVVKKGNQKPLKKSSNKEIMAEKSSAGSSTPVIKKGPKTVVDQKLLADQNDVKPEITQNPGEDVDDRKPELTQKLEQDDQISPERMLQKLQKPRNETKQEADEPPKAVAGNDACRKLSVKVAHN